MIGHECFGLANKVCGQCQHDKKMCQDILVEGESLCSVPDCLVTDALVVDSMAVALHQACQKGGPCQASDPVQVGRCQREDHLLSHDVTVHMQGHMGC